MDEGRFHVVLVVDESRLASDELVAALIRDRLKRAGVLVATLSGERDLTDPSDNFVANILRAAHAFEQDLRIVKMLAGHRAAAKEGIGREDPHLSGSAPWKRAPMCAWPSTKTKSTSSAPPRG